MPCYELLGIEICIPSVEDIVNGIIAPINRIATDAQNAITRNLSPLFDTVINTITPYFSSLLTSIQNWGGPLLNAITSTTNNIWEIVKGIPSQIGTAIGNITGAISAAVEGITLTTSTLIADAQAGIGTAIDGLGLSLENAINAVGEGLGLAFDGVQTAISGVIGNIFSGFGFVDIADATTSMVALTSAATKSIRTAYTRHSPTEPESIWFEVQRLREEQSDHFVNFYNHCLAIEGLSLGQVDTPVYMLLQKPEVEAAMQLAVEWYRAPYDIAYQPLLERYWLETFTPKLPSYSDMISIYVREGYLPEKWVEFPEEMGKWFKQLGYSEYWAKRLWGKHWVLPAPTMLYEMLHRTKGTRPEIGVDEELLRKMLKLHDYEPEWRPRMEAISWRTWRIFDIRTDWEMGLEDEETVLKRLIDTGYHPDEARVLLEVQKMFVLRSEIDAILREVDQDFIEGWISEEQLRADYEATPYRPELRELRIARAKLRRERELKRDIKRALMDRFIKGDLTEEEFKQELSRLGVVQEWISAEVERAKARKLKRIKAA